jgi:hypothetical protein
MKMSQKSIVFSKKLKVINKLKDDFLNDIKFIYVLEDFKNKSNAFIVTNDDKVFVFGNNRDGVLGLGHKNKVNELTINEDLSYKRLTDFKNGYCHVIALTVDGKVFCWGYNWDGVLGNGREEWNIYKPQLNEYLRDKQITHICCGSRHTLVLNNMGEVYAWGENDVGQIGNGSHGKMSYQIKPFKIQGFDGEKVIMISCGHMHSMALTECGHVFSWGDNTRGQLGFQDNNMVSYKPSLVIFNSDISVKKISCGYSHSLLLTRDGDIYWFGDNASERLTIPKRLSINANKFIDIATHFYYNISVALSEEDIFYIWGKCGEELIQNPKETQFESFQEIFANYFQITYKEIHRLEKCLKSLNQTRKNEYKLKFEEKKFISSGNFGIVCEAIEKESNKKFAIKKIPLNEDQKERVFKEIEVMSKLYPKYVVKCFDFWIEENYYLNNSSDFEENSDSNSSHDVYNKHKSILLHIQMELCYKTLKDIINILNIELNRKKSEVMDLLGFYITCELFSELLESVNYLHKQIPPIIHRDLKPSNILISYGKNGRFVKLGDFGLATTHEFEEQSHTKYTGTRIYTAPEVMHSKHYDTKVDIYSLGIIIQELFNIDINK